MPIPTVNLYQIDIGRVNHPILVEWYWYTAAARQRVTCVRASTTEESLGPLYVGICLNG